MQQRPPQFQIRANGIIGLAMVILFFIALFFIARGIFTLLAWLAPALIIGALLINYRTVLGFLKYLWNLLRRNPLMGILVVILTIIGFPIVSGFLFGKSIFDRKVRKIEAEMRRHREGELIDYEEIREEEGEILDLETLPPPEKRKGDSPYDDLFDTQDKPRQ